jgi:gliding motility-associated-like protein
LAPIAAIIAPEPTVNAGEPKSIELGDSVRLETQAEGVSTFRWEPSTGLNSTEIQSPTASPQVDTQYFVEVVNEFGCISGSWVTVRVQQPLVIYNTISPNNDGSNDYFVIENLDTYSNHRLRIIDRWGKEVFFSENYQNNWDGTLDGEPLPNDTYYYIIEFNEKNKSSETGWIAILK